MRLLVLVRLRNFCARVFNKLERIVRVTPDAPRSHTQSNASNVERLTNSVARRNNLGAVQRAADAAGVAYFAIPDENRRTTRIGVPSSRWAAFCSSLIDRTSGAVPFEFVVRESDGNGGTNRHTISSEDKNVLDELLTQDIVRVFQPLRDPRSSFNVGAEAACSVERWEEHPDGTISAPTKNQRSTVLDRYEVVPARTNVDGTNLRTFQPFTAQSIFEHAEPVDVVVMWVDGEDVVWQKKRDATLLKLTGKVPADSFDKSRFRDNSELKYSLRSIFAHAPWVRNIILVTDSQVPEWLDTSHPRIRMVHHEELFGAKGVLPTFNSHAIASRIHHVEGLSEQYLIFNDDVFLGHDVGPRHFFNSNGVAKFFLSQATLPKLKTYELTHEAARNNVVQLLENEYGVTPSRAFLHTPVVQLKSLMLELEDKYPRTFAITQSNQLRSLEDYEINGWMHHYFGYMMRRTIPGGISYNYFDMSDPELQRRLNEVSDTRKLATFCLNDSPEASSENQQFAQHWLETYFPYSAPWERE